MKLEDVTAVVIMLRSCLHYCVRQALPASFCTLNDGACVWYVNDVE